MESFNPLLAIILIIFGILNIILFFKFWGMTNDVRELKNHFIPKEEKEVNSNSENGSTDNGWAENVTDKEKIDASKLFYRLEEGHVVAKVISKKKLEIWTSKFWEAEKGNPDYKLIFRK